VSNLKQYINIIKSNQNIKVDHQILENNLVISASSSVFLLQDNLFSSDTLFKLQSLEQSIKTTFISAICESKEQKIVKKHDAKKKDCSYIPYDSNNFIELNNTNIETSTLFNNNGNIDYLISPFTLLQNHLTTNLEANSLNLFILNDNIYMIILGEDKRYIESAILSLTPFNDIKTSEFYTDEVVEQKLYDEIYLLELIDQISNIIKNYYEKFNNTNFIEKVNLFYTIKQLQDEQIETLGSELMLEISYEQIHLDTLLFTITQKHNAPKYSYIEPRPKKGLLNKNTWAIIALSSIILVFLVIYYMQETQQKENKITKDVLTKTNPKEKAPIQIKEIKLPDYVFNNTIQIEFIKKLFDTIDENTVLKEIQIQEDESTMICDFYTINAQEKFLNSTILKLYEKSEIVLMSSSNETLTTIVSNNTLLDIPETKMAKVTTTDPYVDEFLTQKYLSELFGKDTKVSFEEEKNTKFSQQFFTLTTKVKKPIHFYQIIETINNQKYSITLAYPIEFIKTNDSLEVTFTLIFNQTLQTN
jgi:hypothetical protein